MIQNTKLKKNQNKKPNKYISLLHYFKKKTNNINKNITN